MRKQKKPVTADFSKTCAGCEYLVQEPWARGKTACRCFAPGPNRGYHMGTTCLLPYVPAWCPKRTRGAWKVSESKANRTRNLRYKRPALASMGWQSSWEELDAIQEACSDIHWFADQDDETLLNALDGNDEDVWEFKLAFASLEAQADQLADALREQFSPYYPKSLLYIVWYR